MDCRRFVLSMFRIGQTHPVPFAAWRNECREELVRIAQHFKQDGFYFQLNDTETGEVENIH